METKTVSAKKYFCYTTIATLNTLHEVAGKEVDLLFEEAENLKLEYAGPLEFIYFDCTNDKDKSFTLEIALPVKEEKGNTNTKYHFKSFGDFKCIAHLHKGSISNIYEVYGKVFTDIHNKGNQPGNQVREVYEKFEFADSPENITEIQVGIL